MRDRFPYVALAGLVFLAVAGWLFHQTAQRGRFADSLSTYRSAPDGARGLFLLAEASGLAVSRRHVDLRQIDPELGALVLLGVDRLEEEELEPLQEFVVDGGQLVIVLPFPPKAEEDGEEEKTRWLDTEPTGRSLLEAFDVTFTACDSPDVERSFEMVLPSRLTRGVEAPEGRLAGYLGRDEGETPALTLLSDPHGEDRAVALALDHGSGRVIVLAAPDLATNRALARADNARLWVSLLGALELHGPVEFDEFHHGFTGDRSVAAYAARHGMHWALLQLMGAIALAAYALRRFGRPRSVTRDERVGRADYLLAMARIYRQGSHREHVTRLLFDGVLRFLARKAGLKAHATPLALSAALAAQGRPDLVNGLRDLSARVGRAQETDASVLDFARACSALRKLAGHEQGARRPATKTPVTSRPAGPAAGNPPGPRASRSHA